jgi:hypothetical protein
VESPEKIENSEKEPIPESVTWTMDSYTWDPHWDQGTLSLEQEVSDQDEENGS